MAEREEGRVQYMGWSLSGTRYRYDPVKGMSGFYVGEMMFLKDSSL
jgi:hypothetical protein